MSERYSLYDAPVLYSFRQVLPEVDRFLNCQYIHPLKQRQLAETVQVAQINSNVAYLAVFGSSITERCGVDSDIDLVIWDKSHTFRPPNNDAYDLFYADQLNGSWSVYDDILNRGVIIYARDNARDCEIRSTSS